MINIIADGNIFAIAIDKEKTESKMKIMKNKLLVLIFFLSLFLVFTPPTYAIPFINPDLLKIKLPPGIFASPTPTPVPTNTPTPTPTPTLIPPTETLAPESTQEVTIIVTPTSTISATATVSPTAKPEKKPLSQKEKIYYGVFGLLVLVIFIQSWPKIKKLLHDKTA